MKDVKGTFGGRLRTRVCGICIENNSILLINHKGIGESGELWAPPGGEINFGETIEEALKREFLEETNLSIEVRKFMAINEFFNAPFHAIELFYLVHRIDGALKLGSDPELSAQNQLINDVRFVTFEELNELPNQKKHNLLHKELSTSSLLNMKGYFKLWQ